MEERNMNVYTKCVFVSTTHVIFDVTIRSGSELIAEGNAVLDTTLNGDYEFQYNQQYGNQLINLIQQAVNKCKIRAEKILRQ